MPIQDNCNPYIIDIGASNDGSLTTSDIRAMTSEDFVAQGLKEVGMDHVIASARMAKKAGAKESMMSMLLMGRIKGYPEGISAQSSGPGGAPFIAPFFFRNQVTNINDSYWKVSAGAAAPGAGTNGIPVHAWRFTVVKHDGEKATDIAKNFRYFNPGKEFRVETQVAGAHVSQVYEIIDNEDATSGSVAAYVIVKPKMDEDEWNALTSGQQAAYQLTTGVAQVLANSVSDFESYGGNNPVNNPRKLRLNWHQTSRFVTAYTDDYVRAMKAPNTSEYLKKYALVPLAEQNKQQFMLFMKEWQNSIMFGTPISPKQTEATYRDLPPIYDPSNSGQQLEWKANAPGFITQLAECSRIQDAQNAALDLNDIFAAGLSVKFAREADGGEVNRIEVHADRITAGNIHKAMLDLYPKIWGVEWRKVVDATTPVTGQKVTTINHNTYQLPAEFGGYDLVVIWDRSLDDKIAAAGNSATVAAAQRYLFMFDWSDLEVSVLKSKSRTTQTNELDEKYRYVIEVNKAHVKMQSVTWSAVMDDPNRHWGIRNFTADCPDLVYEGCAATAA